MTLTCQQFTGLVSDLLDGDLDAEAAQTARAHADACGQCHQLLAGLRQTVSLLGDEHFFALPDGAHERLQAAIEADLGEPLLPSLLAPAAARAATEPSPRSQPPVSIWARLWGGGEGRRMRAAGWATAVVLLLLAGGVMHWRAGAVNISGWLIDTHCLATYRARLDIHPSACLLKCGKTNAVGVVDAKGKFTAFDSRGRRKVLAEVARSRKPDHLWVTVHGRRAGTAAAPMLDVEQVQLTAPGTR